MGFISFVVDNDGGAVYGNLVIGGDKIAGALNNQTLNLDALTTANLTIGSESINATNIAKRNAAAKANENVAGIERPKNEAGNNITEIENTLRIYDNGTISTVNGAFRVNPQGAVFAESINIGDGAFTVNNNGGVSVAQGINAAGGKFNISADGTLSMNQDKGNIFAVNDNGDITASGTFNALSGDYRVSNINGETTMQLGAANLTETQLANLNSTIREGQVVDAKELNVNGSNGGFRVKDVNYGADTMIYAVNADGNPTLMIDADTGNLATPGSISAGNGAFVANENGAEVTGTFEVNDGVLGVNADGVTIGENFAVNAQNGAVEAVEYKVNDSNVFNASGLTASAGNVGGVEIANGKVDGVDISDLNTTVTSNLSGIDRIDSDYDGKLDTTIIEDALSANTSTVNMFGNTGLDFTYGHVPNSEAGVNVTGNMHFMSGADVTFNYNGTKYENKSYSLNDLVDGINDLNGRVDVLEKKTHGISYDEETGTTTVDGNLNVEGDAITGEGGNLNAGAGNFDKVSTDEITVGETYIDGDSVNSVEGNFENITADKGNIGGVGLEGGTVIADKVVTGNTKLDNEGLNVGGNGGTTVSKDGVSIADKTIISDHDVVINEGTADRVSLSETADRVSNLEQGVSELNNRVGELEDRIDKVGAMAAAIANLRTMGYDPAAPTEVAVGIGQYRDETGAALGLFHYPNRDFMLSLSVSTSGDEVMGGIGATWKFGRKSPEKVAEIKKAQAEADARRAEEAKLAKAEEMKQAAKEAKIKAQQERHAKLAAERAAQAEAAK